MAHEERVEARERSVDPDVETLGASQVPRPVHLRFSYVCLVFVGGVFGTLARYGLSHALPAPQGWPLPTLAVNLCGSFALGLLLEGLVRRGADTGRRKVLRWLAGTGFLGAFTTYSTLALEANLLFADGSLAAAGSYLGAGLVGGVLAAWAGILIGSAHHRRRTASARTVLPAAGREEAP